MTRIEDIKIFDHHDGKIKWNIKKDAVELYNNLKVHANGEIPTKIISERRPNEPQEILEYRKKIYKAKTQHPISKVETSLTKIRRSPDYKVDYSETETPYSLKDFSLQDYLEKKYPIYDNIDSWLFDECLQNVLIDTNAVCAILPMKYNGDITEMINAFAYIANVDEVIYFKENDYTIFESDKDITVVKNGIEKEYCIYVLSTQNEIVEYYIEETDRGKLFVELNRLTHNLGELQAFRFRGVFYKNEDGDVIWKSPINSMVIHLDEGARIYSDLQAEYVLHMHSEKWVINTNQCKKCDGFGKLKIGFSATKSDCTSCGGTGYEKVSPFQNHTINLDLSKPNSSIPPIPPTGYVQKSIEIAKILDEQYSKHLYQALEAINMQFLFEVPLSESGIAKQWDRDETDNFAYKVASILRYIRENVAYYINNLRYYYTIPDKDTRNKQLPKISIPEKYDLVNNALLIEEYKQLKDAKASPFILASKENEIALKMFSHDKEITTFTSLVYKLDPLYYISEDEKIMRLQNNGIEEVDYVVSSNIHKFIRRALSEDEKFAEKTYQEQVEVINSYAQEVINNNKPLQALVVDND